MKLLYLGGQKSGKSRLAEARTLELARERGQRPIYLATYDDRYGDAEMAARLARHKARRQERFETIEEPIRLDRVVEDGGLYLVDCLSMWILNLLEAKIDYETILAPLLAREADLVFVLNDVGRGIIPDDPLTRRYVDMSGMIGQEVAAACDEVYEVVVGIERRLR